MRVVEAVDTPLRTAVALAVLPTGIVFLSCGAMLLALLTRSNRQVHWAYLGFARMCMLIGSTDLQVHGAHHARSNPAYVVVANHESNWDPPSIIAGLPDLIIRFIVKQQIMRIPIFGHALRLTGNVTVERNRAAGDIRRIRRGMEERTQDVSMLFFAEGTRSRDGHLQTFKKGAFATAISHDLPILPVAIAGSRLVWSADSIAIHRGPVVIEIGEPISAAGLELSDRDALRVQCEESVRKLRARAYDRIRAQGFPTPPDVN
jgi:1-acyl-sn-glycerol-3-phosphate acyltransferase